GSIRSGHRGYHDHHKHNAPENASTSKRHFSPLWKTFKPISNYALNKLYCTSRVNLPTTTTQLVKLDHIGDRTLSWKSSSLNNISTVPEKYDYCLPIADFCN
ncbi:hypothetical protein, partial [uncultured Bartonella sp.]|uniref:hypothetical protein n=1 Tax=uncultured Bartonella sp. TaxID=104108 RepID=UPI00262CAE47